VRGAKEKNSEAWKTLCRRYLPLVWRYAYALVQDVHLAEDIAGETMLALLKGIGQIDDDSPKISAWLRGVVRHKIADHHRRSFRINDRLEQVGQNQQQPSHANPAESLENSETRDQVLQTLDQMSERQRMALEWKYVEGLRVREIAQRLDETEKAVEATLYRARREFRRRFQLVESPSQQEIPGLPTDADSRHK